MLHEGIPGKDWESATKAAAKASGTASVLAPKAPPRSHPRKNFRKNSYKVGPGRQTSGTAVAEIAIRRPIRILPCPRGRRRPRNSVCEQPSPALRLRRFTELGKSDSPLLKATAMLPWMRELMEWTKALAFFRKERIETLRQSQAFWKHMLYTSADGKALKVANAPACSEWVRDCARLLTGHAFINAVKLRINALPNLTRAKRGRDTATTCRAGCRTEESLGHILQRCHHTHHVRIQRYDNIFNYSEEASRVRVPGGARRTCPHDPGSVHP